MKRGSQVLLILVAAMVGAWQRSDREFLERVRGLERLGRMAREGVVFRRPKISPDGQWVAFVSDAPRRALWLARLGDLTPRRLAQREDRAEIRQFGWSPDSRRIAYVDGRAVKLIDVVTGEVTAITTISPFISDPVFTPDGTLAVVANTDLIGNPVAREGDLEKVKRLTPWDRPYLVVRRPEEKEWLWGDLARAHLVGEDIIVPYVLGPRREVYLHVNGEDRRITPVEPSRAVAPCLYVFLSPDRRKLALECDGKGSSLSVYEIASRRIYDLGPLGFGSWSPGGEWILCDEEISDGHRVFWNDLYITHYTGGKRVKIGRARGTVWGASWGRDGLVAYDEEGAIVISKILVK